MRAIPAFLALCVAFAAPASAQPLTIEDVRAMAFAKGIVQIEEVELDDGIWEVEGIDASGHEIKMEIEAGSGQIVKLKRD
ncbi:MAG: PepSY domain-containing protein [Methyloceanibacter sp.]